ncbi:MAG: glycosyltransferase family 9 protein [Bryobacterales bacterium]|nr:glycosyltransferase family 9 protein [Bryobacterales bacterium]
MEPERILIVRLGAFGDIIHTLPAAATLRANCPRAKITWLVEPRWAALLEGNPDVDEVIAFDRRGPRSWPHLVGALRRARFDLAIDFQGLLKSALPVRFSGARVRVGLAWGAAREALASFCYSRTCTPTARHIVDQHLELAGFAVGGESVVRFAIPEGQAEGELPERFVLACPLAGWRSKQWPLERYEELAGLVRERLDVPLVLNGAPGQVEELRRVRRAVTHVSGLPGLIDATRRALAVVGLDSGPMHLAAALRKPGVALFGPTDPARNGPYCDTMPVLREAASVTTYKRGDEHEPGLASIPAARVMEVLLESLRNHEAGTEAAG